ncbi:hypothetical protein [Cellulomonas carbonis]|uniref:Uncharacterized protein n=1 Tax=Cellulomonas carbonis T26 TaxID=947969 RepID=A0A0A0BWG7_9CELL|nr:hypothetical protein [Cellulomonas carbonis]KGM12305.1 hypothetical protein N868_18225 [Cellulomonas carbonis T26]GGC01570.1 hypothetical protein GCM10010972_12960 [Cellulomonas carbonis]
MTTGAAHPAAPASPSAAASAAPSSGWGSAWEDALAELELDVALAEQMLTLGHIAQDPPAPWAPPAGLGPLPTDLVDRARTVLDRQLDVARRLAEAADLSRRHTRAVQAMRATAPSVPVYLDTPA